MKYEWTKDNLAKSSESLRHVLTNHFVGYSDRSTNHQVIFVEEGILLVDVTKVDQLDNRRGYYRPLPLYITTLIRPLDDYSITLDRATEYNESYIKDYDTDEYKEFKLEAKAKGAIVRNISTLLKQ